MLSVCLFVFWAVASVMSVAQPHEGPRARDAFLLGPGAGWLAPVLSATKLELLREQDGGLPWGGGSRDCSPAPCRDCDLAVVLCPRL